MKQSTQQKTNNALTARHTHSDAQFFLVRKGEVYIEDDQFQRIIMPNFIGWIPANTPHRATFAKGAIVSFLYFDAQQPRYLPAQPQVYPASELALALFNRLTMQEKALDDDFTTKLMALLQQELAYTEPANLQLPLPTHPRLRPLVNTLRANPADDRSLHQLAQAFGFSTRTLTRYFKAQTGMSFNQWRQRMRLLASLALLREGRSVDYCAAAVGYQSTSSYIRLFKHYLHQTPKQFSLTTKTVIKL